MGRRPVTVHCHSCIQPYHLSACSRRKLLYLRILYHLVTGCLRRISCIRAHTVTSPPVPGVQWVLTFQTGRKRIIHCESPFLSKRYKYKQTASRQLNSERELIGALSYTPLFGFVVIP